MLAAYERLRGGSALHPQLTAQYVVEEEVPVLALAGLWRAVLLALPRCMAVLPCMVWCIDVRWRRLLVKFLEDLRCIGFLASGVILASGDGL